MNKPNSLRRHLLQHIDELKHNPDRLLVFIENGTVRCTAAAGLSFEYEYQLQLVIVDYAGHPDTVMIPLLDWMRTHQHDALANFEKNQSAIQFDADILAGDLVDLSITLQLTERVIVKSTDDGLAVTHPPEPQLTEHLPQQKYTLYIDGKPAANWQSGEPKHQEIETPWTGHKP